MNRDMKKSHPEKSHPKKGRPRSRFAERDEQVRQNMRLYRARRAAELEALARALDRLSDAVALADTEKCTQAAQVVAAMWSSGSIRESVIKSRNQRQAQARKTTISEGA
jgi:hypothetical protein